MNNNQLTFLDIISIMSFCISLMNLDENLSQGDKQDLQNDLAEKMEIILQEIHGHLEKQDIKIDKILEEVSNDNR
jgi:hypothetical protein